MFTVLFGLQGSGKSYEATKNYVVAAIRQGRRCVTNISGIKPELVYEYLVQRGCDRSKLGELVVVSNERVAEPDFFCGEPVPTFKFDVPPWIPLPQLGYYASQYVITTGKTFGKTAFQLLLPDLKACVDAGLDAGSCLVEAAHQEWKTLKLEYFKDRPRNEVFAELPSRGDSVVKPGDLVVIDECWRFWDSTQKVPIEHNNFFRMHRHYVSPVTGVSCDIVGLIQDWDSLNRNVKGLVAFAIRFQKLRALGLMSRYRYDTFDGKPSRGTLLSSSPWQKYDPAIFPLYKSYDTPTGAAKEVADKRQSIFSNRWFQVFFGGGVIAFLFMSFKFAGMLANMAAGRSPFEEAPVASAKPAGAASAPAAGSPLQPRPGQLPGVPVASAEPAQVARLVGVIKESRTGKHVAILETASGRLEYVRMDQVALTQFGFGPDRVGMAGGSFVSGFGSQVVGADGQKYQFVLRGGKDSK